MKEYCKDLPKILNVDEGFADFFYSEKTIVLSLTDPFLVKDTSFVDEMIFLCDMACKAYYNGNKKIEINRNVIAGYVKSHDINDMS